MNSSNIPSSDRFESVLSWLYRSVGIPLCISGNLGIVFSTWVFHWKTWRKNVCVFYLLISLLINFVNINNTLLANIGRFGLRSQLVNTSAALCKLVNYVTFVFDELSSSVLVLASIDRLLISSTDVETRLYSSRRLAYFSLSVSTVAWTIYLLHIPIKFDVYQLGPPVSLCLFEPVGFYADFLFYSQLILNLLLFLLMVVLSVFSYKNVRQMKLLPRQPRHARRTMHRKDFQLLRCLFVKNIVHIVGNSVMVAYTIYRAVTISRVLTAWEQARDSFIFNLCLFIHSIPYCTDFYIYAMVSRAFRQEITRIFAKIFGQHHGIGREEDREPEVRHEQAELSIVGAAASAT